MLHNRIIHVNKLKLSLHQSKGKKNKENVVKYEVKLWVCKLGLFVFFNGKKIKTLRK